MLEYSLVLLVGFIVGTINGMAGGASLLSFPVLLAIGMNPVSATVTNSLGVSRQIFLLGSQISKQVGKFFINIKRLFSWLLVFRH